MAKNGGKFAYCKSMENSRVFALFFSFFHGFLRFYALFGGLKSWKKLEKCQKKRGKVSKNDDFWDIFCKKVVALHARKIKLSQVLEHHFLGTMIKLLSSANRWELIFLTKGCKKGLFFKGFREKWDFRRWHLLTVWNVLIFWNFSDF